MRSANMAFSRAAERHGRWLILLAWLAANHFIFLGLADYQNKNGALTLNKKSALGIYAIDKAEPACGPPLAARPQSLERRGQRAREGRERPVPAAIRARAALNRAQAIAHEGAMADPMWPATTSRPAPSL